jgi:hypothetical protein
MDPSIYIVIAFAMERMGGWDANVAATMHTLSRLHHGAAQTAMLPFSFDPEGMKRQAHK